MSGAAHIRRVRALHQRKYREAGGLFLVQGRKAIGELLTSGLEIVELHATEKAARELDLAYAIISPAHDLERMGTFQQGNELVAVVRKPEPPAMQMPAAGELVMALDEVADPGNLGTLLRVADWFGVTQVWCSQGTVELYNPKCVQAGMGALFRVAAPYMDLPAALCSAAEQGVSVYLAESSGRNVFNTGLSLPAVLVLGSESHGLSTAVKAVPATSVAVPRFGKAESLNVAAAAAALCMEFVRQTQGR